MSDETENEDEDETEDESRDESYFMGDCTCLHDREDHGWGECGMEGCDCQAGWEE